ncbi:MAG: hypothetical protein JWQ57_4479 [Mucilaginibacter sp.]|nr:hypothetical protein [Mucilaginibacter sp.]
MRAPFEYDIAISFAEEDRNAALALALALEASGVKKVYYYPDQPGATTGKVLKDELRAIYSDRAEFAVALLSEDYLKKEHSMVEMEAIKIRMKQETEKTYLIPVVMEDAFIDLMPEIKAIGYLKWEANPKRIASVITGILGKKVGPDQKKKQKKLIEALLTKHCNNVVSQKNSVQAIVNFEAHKEFNNVIITNTAKNK